MCCSNNFLCKCQVFTWKGSCLLPAAFNCWSYVIRTCSFFLWKNIYILYLKKQTKKIKYRSAIYFSVVSYLKKNGSGKQSILWTMEWDIYRSFSRSQFNIWRGIFGSSKFWTEFFGAENVIKRGIIHHGSQSFTSLMADLFKEIFH